MNYAAKILLDSASEAGARLTTFSLTFPRFLLAEFNTHRMLSRNAASSRAIPVEKMIERAQQDPVMPIWWGKNQLGMQAQEELGLGTRETAKLHWLSARDHALQEARTLMEFGAHKQIVNRLLEPWLWVTVIASATEWANFFYLRCHEDAQPEIRRIAALALLAYHKTQPQPMPCGEWHCPLIQSDERQIWAESDEGVQRMKKVSVARCARISYLTHDGRRDSDKDIELFDRLQASHHNSPFEHVAMASSDPFLRSGNFTGWVQFRATAAKEHPTAITHEDRERLIEKMWAQGALPELDA